jgi:hypothetical protein
MKEDDMRSFLLLVVLGFAVFTAACQVQVPTVDTKALMDSVAVLRAEIGLLKARPVIIGNGNSGDVLNGQLQFMAVPLLKTGTTTFGGTAWRKAVYLPGISSNWSFTVTPIYAIEAPAYDFLTVQVKTDSLIVRRQANGTSGLSFSFVGIGP